MLKNSFYSGQMLWIANNLGMVLRVLILTALVLSFLFAPHVVLADPIMGGSVGKAAKGILLP
jgi:hypothetical protein